MTKIDPGDGWNEWRNKVLSDIKETKEGTKQLQQDFVSFKVEVVKELQRLKTEMSVRSGVLGAISGLLGALAVVLIYLATN